MQKHKPIEELVHNNDDVQVQIIFTVPNDNEDKRAAPVRHLASTPVEEAVNGSLQYSLSFKMTVTAFISSLFCAFFDTKPFAPAFNNLGAYNFFGHHTIYQNFFFHVSCQYIADNSKHISSQKNFHFLKLHEPVKNQLTSYESYMINYKKRSRTTVSMYIKALRTILPQYYLLWSAIITQLLLIFLKSSVKYPSRFPMERMSCHLPVTK